MIEGMNPNGQIPATTNDEQTIPAGSKAQPRQIIYTTKLLVFIYAHVRVPSGILSVRVTDTRASADDISVSN